MPIQDKGSLSAFQQEFQRRIEKAENAIVNTLKYIGEMCVNEARNNGNYIDQTGNLRSSIGYVVVKNGKKVTENLKQSDRGTDKQKGVTEAKRFIDELIARNNRGITLIVVAGMNYATYVESKRNVLASAQLLAEKETPRMLQQLGFIKRT